MSYAKGLDIRTQGFGRIRCPMVWDGMPEWDWMPDGMGRNALCEGT